MTYRKAMLGIIDFEHGPTIIWNHIYIYISWVSRKVSNHGASNRKIDGRGANLEETGR